MPRARAQKHNTINRLREMREARGLSQTELGELIGSNRFQVFRLETGRRQMTERWAQRFATALQCGIDEILVDRGAATAELIGSVGGSGEGEEVQLYRGIDASHERLPAPPGFRDPVAVVVRGQSMWPAYRDGDVLFLERPAAGVPAEALGQDCIVLEQGGAALIKRVEASGEDGSYDLASYGPIPIRHRRILVWASPVTWIQRGQPPLD